MRISTASIQALSKIITGDKLQHLNEPMAPYRSGPMLVNFFNDLGADDQYHSGFPARYAYTEEHLRKHESAGTLSDVVGAALDPRHFLNTEFRIEAAVEYLNQYLEFDGLQVNKAGRYYRLTSLTTGVVEIKGLFTDGGELTHTFIDEQLEKCDRKLSDEDYDGAITNARSLLEAVLIELEERITDADVRYDGDLMKLFKRVQKLLNLSPDRQDISDALRQMLSGLVSITAGLAALRNKMSDAHARDYRPSRHHATLAVNCAKSVVEFLYGSLQYQVVRGHVTLRR